MMNITKTEAVVFSTDRNQTELPTMIKDEISISSSVKFLGLYIDKHLKWNDHLEYLTKRLNSVIYTVNVLRTKVDLATLKLIYFANFQSLLSYGIIFWGSCPGVEVVFLRQKAMLRTMLHLGYRTSCRGHFRIHNILTLHGLFIYRVLLFMNQHSKYFEHFRTRSNTRHTQPFLYPLHSLTSTERSPLYMGIKLFNALPKDYQRISNPSIFKKKLHGLLIDCEPYSMEEFKILCRATIQS